MTLDVYLYMRNSFFSFLRKSVIFIFRSQYFVYHKKRLTYTKHTRFSFDFILQHYTSFFLYLLLFFSCLYLPCSIYLQCRCCPRCSIRSDSLSGLRTSKKLFDVTNLHFLPRSARFKNIDILNISNAIAKFNNSACSVNYP